MPHSNTRNTSLILIASCILLFVTGCDFGSKDSPQVHIDKAKTFIANNQLNEGVIELKNALQIESNLPEARWMLGKVYLQTGNGAAAFKEISQAQSLGFSDPELNKVLLQAMLLQGKNQEILDKTFTEDEMSNDTLLLRGDAHLGLREYEEARAAYAQVRERDSRSVSARKGLIQVDLLEQKLEDAEQLIEDTLSFALEDAEVWMLKGQLAFLQNKPTEAETAYTKAVTLDVQNMAAQLGLARALLLQGKNDEVLKPVAAIEARFPNHPLAKYYRGYIALIDKDSETAKVLLQDVVAVLPTHPETLLLLSRIHYDEGQLEQAETYLTTFLANYPNHLPARKLLSVIQLRLKQPGASVATLSDAATQAQADWQVLALLGSALMESGDLEKGMASLEQAAKLNPDTAEIHTQLAIGHLATGALGSAVTELESAIKLDPAMVRADILLILAHLQAKEFDAAITAAQKFAEKQPDNPLSYNLLGAAYLSKEDTDKARVQFEKALALDAKFIPARANLARLDMRNGDTDAAEKKLKQILEIDENNPAALEALAQIESGRGNIDKVRSLLEQARSANPQALGPRVLLSRFYLNRQNPKKLLQVITEAEKLAPNNLEVQLLLGQAHRLNGQNKQAIATLEALQKLAPDAPEVSFQLSLAKVQAGDLDAAKSNLNAILEKDKGHLGALLTLARLAINAKDFVLANDYATRIGQTKENAVQAHALKGDILMAQQKYKEAIGAYDKAFTTMPNSTILIKIAEAHKLGGEEDKGIAVLNDWLKDHPEDAGASLYLASTYQQSNKDRQATEKYEGILKQNPDNVIALNNLAWLYIDSNPARALDLARKAHKQAPDNPEVMDTLGWILVQQKKVEEGLSYLEAAQAKSRLPDIRYHFAAGLHAAGDKGRAKTELMALLEEVETFPARAEAEILLGKIK